MPGTDSTKPGTDSKKPRLLVLTDISSLVTGVREPDDGQSMIRLMLYANEFEIEGLIATSNMNHGERTRPELIHEVVDAYAKVRPRLLEHSDGYPEPDRLREVIKSGIPRAGRTVPVEECVGDGMDTEASEWIVRALERSDPRPLWITIWGGPADLAQALWTLRRTRPESEVRELLGRARVHAISDQDTTAPWIKAEFPELFYISNIYGHRGMYRAGDTSLVSHDWVEEHIRHGHGALGALYPNYDGGDNRTKLLGRVRGIKEGDTPSFLSLLPNGLGDASDPDGWRPQWGSWGGRFRLDSPNRYVDAVDRLEGSESDPDPYMAATYRWRPAYQADFQARLDWCVKPFKEANHPPVPVIAGDASPRPVYMSAAPGESLELSADGSFDPDGDRLRHRWWVYAEAGRGASGSALQPSEGRETILRVDESARPGDEVHVILELTDGGDPPLSRYRRIIVRVKEA